MLVALHTTQQLCCVVGLTYLLTCSGAQKAHILGLDTVVSRETDTIIYYVLLDHEKILQHGLACLHPYISLVVSVSQHRS